MQKIIKTKNLNNFSWMFILIVKGIKIKIT